MKLVELQITNLRNILSARLAFHPHLNIISGVNGSGKTSFLEALYLLGCGHSFRTRDVSALVSHKQSVMTVYAKADDFQKISIQKSLNKPTVAMLNGLSCTARSELATFLPCQIFYQDIFQLIDAGPAPRRELMDWGLFHVEHSYHSLWNDYRRVLKQRNSLIRNKVPIQQVLPWNIKLAELAYKLDAFREQYFNRLSLEFDLIINQLGNVSCSLQYYKGWDKKNEGKLLEDVLYSTWQSDCLRQYTHYGAHHADLLVVSKDCKVKHFLSRGQQKVVLFALKFAQAKLLNKSCVFLIDDLSSELDEGHISRIIQYCASIDGQFFITARQSDHDVINLLSGTHTHYLVENGSFAQQSECLA